MQIFVLGTGRSGTHWVGHLLDSHPDIRTTIESPRIFRLATKAALHSHKRQFRLAALRLMYSWESSRSAPRHYADKSHPAIWFADQLAVWFPNARFIGIERSPYGTIASMLRHSGVRQWQENWQAYGIPNQFLGVTPENADSYEMMSPVERAAIRWCAHRDRMENLSRLLGERLLVIDYEDLFDNYEARLLDMWGFLGVEPVEVEEHRPNESSRYAWRRQLTENEIQAIESITGIPAS